MELELDVLSSLSIKRKKPWSKFSWLEENDPPHGLYLFSEGGRISQLSLSSGKTRRKFPTLFSVHDRIALTVTSPSGSYMGGLLLEGDLFVWDKVNDTLETFVTPLSKMDSEKMGPQWIKGTKMFLSDSGEHALLISSKVELYLWEVKEYRSLWWKLFPPKGVQLLKNGNREMAVEAAFHSHSILGECCTCVFAFTDHSTGETVITNLFINYQSPVLQFYSDKQESKHQSSGLMSYPFVTKPDKVLEEPQRDKAKKGSRQEKGFLDRAHGNSPQDPKFKGTHRKHSGSSVALRDLTNTSHSSSISSSAKDHTHIDPHTQFDQLSNHDPISPFETSWSTISRPPITPSTSHQTPLTGRGSYVCRLCPSGNVAALAINCPRAADTEVVFLSPLIRTELAVQVYSRSSEGLTGRTFWIADMAWTADGLLLVCMTKRGSLLIMPRFGPPLKLIARGCSIEMGPSPFLPLHPLITVIGIPRTVTDHETSESSEKDTLRQRFSVSTHPHLPILLCSDGYSLTVLKLPANLSLPSLLRTLVSCSRELIGLPQISKESLSYSQDPTTPSLQLHDLAASVTATCLADTLGSTLNSTSTAGFMPHLGGVDAGGVHFAGLGSTIEFSSSLSKEARLETAVSSLLSAWGMLLTCGLTMPGDGIPRVITAVDSVKHISRQCELKDSTSVLISSILSVLKILQDSSHTADQSSTVFVHAMFSLIPIDSVFQSHFTAVSTLCNGVLMSELERILSQHEAVSQVNKGAQTHQAFIEHIDSMTIALSQFSELLDLVVAIFDGTYTMHAVSNTSNCFQAPSFIHSRSSIACPLQSLSPTCSLLVKVAQIFQQEINTCEQSVKKKISESVGNRLKAREIDVLYNTLTKCLNNAVVTLQYMNTQARLILLSHGNPITSKTHKNQKQHKLVSKLEAYDIQGALEYVHSLVRYTEGIESESGSFTLSKSIQTTLLTLCQVMAIFFTETASELQIPHQITLSRTKLAKAVQSEAILKFWTVDHTLELLLVSQSWLEACTFLQKLGEWKKAFFLAAVFVHHSRLLRVKKEDYAALNTLSQCLAVENLLRSIGLRQNQSSDLSCKVLSSRLSCIPGLNDSHLQQKDIITFLPDCLRVCAYAELDNVLLTTVASMLSEMVQCCRQLSLEVPSTVYLPAPPLFCPQPAVPSEELIQCPMEYKLRHKLSTLVRGLVLIMSSSSTLLPCAHWYCTQLEELVYNGDTPLLSPPGCAPCGVPQGLSQIVRSDAGILFTAQDGSTVKVLLAAFRELCALLWFLHVRDQFSAHLRKLQLFPLRKEKCPDAVVQNASLWSARYLCFTNILDSQSRTTLEGVTSSIISELETTTFLTNILAYSFPVGATEDGKLNRLVSRLRAAHVEEAPGAMAVDYQTKSKATLSNRIDRFGDHLGKFLELLLTENSGCLIEKDAVNVGSFLFEYDSEYMTFLDGLLSVILPQNQIFSPGRNSSLLTLSQLHQSSSTSMTVHTNTPLLSHYLSKLKHLNKQAPCWEQILTLLEPLHLWACSTNQQVTHIVTSTSRDVSKRSIHKRETRLGTNASLKVSISPTLVIKCLRQREDEHHTGNETTTNTAVDATLLSPQQQESTVVESMNDPGLSNSAPKVNKEEKIGQSSLYKELGTHGLPTLIQLPPGTLQGQITGSDVMTPHGPSSHSLSENDGCAETELEDSVSTGELPSALTYSMGEKRTNAKTTTEENCLADTLTEISETVTLTFNDFALPGSSPSNTGVLSIPHTSPNQSPPHSETQSPDHTPENEKDSMEIANISASQKSIEDLEKDDLTLNRTHDLDLVDRTRNEDGDSEVGSEQNEDEGTNDSGTFTVSSSTTLLQESPSHQTLDQDTTLEPVPVDKPSSGHAKQETSSPAILLEGESGQKVQDVDSAMEIERKAQHEPTVMEKRTKVKRKEKIYRGTMKDKQHRTHAQQGQHNSADEPIAQDSTVANSHTVHTDEHAVTAALRLEMKEILKLQEQHLLSLLKAIEAKATQKEVSNVECGTQKDFEGDKLESPERDCQMFTQPPKHVVRQESATTQRSDIMPMLNIDDLQSPSESSYLIPPPSENQAELSTTLIQRDQYVQTAEGLISDSKLALSELTSATDKDSPGVIPTLAQSTTTIVSQHQVRSKDHPVMSTPKQSKARLPAPIPSQFSRIGQPNGNGNPPLLWLDSLLGNQHDRQPRESKLETAYPDFARNTSSIGPRPANVANDPLSSPKKTKCDGLPVLGLPPRPAPTLSSSTQQPPLLRLPDLSGQLDHSQPLRQDPVHQSQSTHCHNQPLLLSLPPQNPQPHVYPSVITLPPQSPPSRHPFQAPPPHSRSIFPSHQLHPSRPHIGRQSQTPQLHSVPIHSPSQASQDPCPLLSLPLQPPPFQQLPVVAPHTNTANKSAPHNPVVSQPPLYQLPNVPLVPFVPTLLPQPEKPRKPKSGPQLLRANDPLQAMKQSGLKLLELSLPTQPKLIGIKHEKYMPRTQETTSTGKHEAVSVQEETLTSASDSVAHDQGEAKLKKKSKRKKRRVAWEQPELIKEPETPIVAPHPHKELQIKATCTTEQQPSTEPEPEAPPVEATEEEDRPTDTALLSVSPEPNLPATNDLAASVPNSPLQESSAGLRKPDFTSRLDRSFPEDIPLESLQLRRLNLQEQLGLTQHSSSSPTNVSVISEASTFVVADSDLRASSIEETLPLSTRSSLAELPLENEPTAVDMPMDEVAPKKSEASRRTESSNEVFHPPVLALNVPEPLHIVQDEHSLSSSSLSSILTLTPTDHNHVEEYFVEPRENPTNRVIHAEKLDLQPPPFDPANEQALSISPSGMSDGPHLEVIKELDVLSKPDPVVSTALKRLHDLEEQLNAIENTAKIVEGEFKSSKQILHTIECLQELADPVSKVTPKLQSLLPVSVPESDTESESTKGDGKEWAVETAGKQVHFPFQDISLPEAKKTEVKASPKRNTGLDRGSPQSARKKVVSLECGTPRRTPGSGTQDRDKLREWMVAKRKERLAEFREQKENQQRLEAHPFKQPTPRGSVSKLQTLRLEKQKREKQQEDVSKRINDAFLLMNDMLSSKPTLNSKTAPSKSTKGKPSTEADKHSQKSAMKSKLRLPPKVNSSPRYGSMNTAVRGNKKQDKDVSGGYKRGKEEIRSNTVGGLKGTYTKSTGTSGLPSQSSTPTRRSLSSARKLSSIEGLTEDEQMQIADILASSVCDDGSVSSGSILTDIDWEEVDKILDS